MKFNRTKLAAALLSAAVIPFSAALAAGDEAHRGDEQRVEINGKVDADRSHHPAQPMTPKAADRAFDEDIETEPDQAFEPDEDEVVVDEQEGDTAATEGEQAQEQADVAEADSAAEDEQPAQADAAEADTGDDSAAAEDEADETVAMPLGTASAEDLQKAEELNEKLEQHEQLAERDLYVSVRGDTASILGRVHDEEEQRQAVELIEEDEEIAEVNSQIVVGEQTAAAESEAPEQDRATAEAESDETADAELEAEAEQEGDTPRA